MTREEALQRIVDNNFAGEYGFDLQILVDCMVVAREIVLNSQFPSEDCISRTQAIKAMDELENEDIEAYGCSIPEGFDGERARQAICLLPSVQPKPKTDVLDKIRAQIKEESRFCPFTEGLERAIEIIDKYKVESEE